jgi:hypothetical protein
MGLFGDKEAAPAPKIISTVNGQELADIVREMGFVPELTTDPGGDPLVRFRIEGLMCLIFFYGVENGRSDSLQFSAGFTIKPALSKVNEWNAKKRFAKAHLDSDGDAIVQMDFELDGGVTKEFIQEQLKRWRGVFLSFASFMRE